MPYFKNDEVNILLIHIPKTGGTSLELYFSNKYNIKLIMKSLYSNNPLRYNNHSLQHCTYKELFKERNYFEIDFTNIKMITVVRNPYERIISDLFFFKYINESTKKEEVFDKMKSYIQSNNVDNHNIPQYKYLIDEDNEIMKDICILRTESLTSDIHKLGYTDFNLHVHKNSKKVNYNDYLNSECIELINEYYDKDFKLFNYEKR